MTVEDEAGMLDPPYYEIPHISTYVEIFCEYPPMKSKFVPQYYLVNPNDPRKGRYEVVLS